MTYCTSVFTPTSSLLPTPPVLLQTSKEDLLQADFEGALKFFRVQLPKRYRAAENARRLMEQACNIKVKGILDFLYLSMKHYIAGIMVELLIGMLYKISLLSVCDFGVLDWIISLFLHSVAVS